MPRRSGLTGFLRSASIARLPFTVSNYELRESLGTWNAILSNHQYSSVFRARKRGDGVEYAFKLMRRPANFRIFQQEVRNLVCLRHPNVMLVHCGFILSDRVPLPVLPGIKRNFRGVLVMELGHTDLNGWCSQHDPRNLQPNMNIFTGIIEGLQYLHSLRIVHGDIQPENIILDINNKPMLSDFGITRQGDRRKVRSSIYCAPEVRVRQDQPCTFQSDIYSLGLILIQIFTPMSYFHKWMYGENYGWLMIQPHFYIAFPIVHCLDYYLVEIVAHLINLIPAERPSLRCLHERIGNYVDMYG